MRVFNSKASGLVQVPLTLGITAIWIATAVPGAFAQTPQEDAKALFEAKCGLCHSIDRPKKKRKTRDAWTKTVMRMKNRNGCPITEEEANRIIDHLSENYGAE